MLIWKSYLAANSCCFKVKTLRFITLLHVISILVDRGFATETVNSSSIPGLVNRKTIIKAFLLDFALKGTVRSRVVNGPTSSGPNPARTRKYKPEPGPNPKTNLKPKSCPKINEKISWFSNAAKLFWLYFCETRTKSTSQARIKPEILSTLSTNPARTRPEKPGPIYNSGAKWIRLRQVATWLENGKELFADSWPRQLGK